MIKVVNAADTAADVSLSCDADNDPDWSVADRDVEAEAEAESWKRWKRSFFCGSGSGSAKTLPEVYIGSGAGFKNQDYPVFLSDSDWIRI